MERIELAKTVRFSALAQQSSGKAETIVIFLAILEMVRNLQVMVYQDEAGGELIIEERGTEHGTEQETGSRPDDGSTIYLGPNE